MATEKLYRIGLVCAIASFICMFIAFATPYWYQSWTRVHSPFGKIGLWHICLNGYIKPRDPVMKSYVGCWWIHSTEFHGILGRVMPVWFRFIQTFAVLCVIGDLLAAIFTAIYMIAGTRSIFYRKRFTLFLCNSLVLFASALLVLIIALVFAEKSRDGSWWPRPWMNYLSWSFGLCVLSGFFAGFGSMVLFILALVFKDKDKNGDRNVTTAAEMAARRREIEKQDEATRQGMAMEAQHFPTRDPYEAQVYKRPQYQQQPAYQDKPHSAYPGPPPGGPPSVSGSQGTRVGESFV